MFFRLILKLEILNLSQVRTIIRIKQLKRHKLMAIYLIVLMILSDVFASFIDNYDSILHLQDFIEANDIRISTFFIESLIILLFHLIARLLL